MIEYLVLAFAPGVFWLWFIWKKDKYEREPSRYLMATFFLGAVMVFPAAFVEDFLTIGEGITDMLVVGLVEEVGKFLAVFLYVYRKSEFNEIMDGIVYSAAAALGFASLENLFYILGFGPGVMVGRAIFSTLGHVLFASFWGYSLGVKKITGKNTLVRGLILSVIAHGIYNSILMSGYWYVMVLVFPLMIILYKSMSGKIRKSLDASPFRQTEVRGVIVCPECGRQLPAPGKFCPYCGAQV